MKPKNNNSMLEKNDNENITSGTRIELRKQECKDIGILKTDMIGRTFGKLTVISRDSNTKWRSSTWKCLCDCGKTKIVRGRFLIVGDTKSCGCIFRTGYGEISGTYFGQLKYNAKRRGHEFNISLPYIWHLYLEQNRKCALSGVNIEFGNNYKGIEFTASLDRTDSSKGYVIGNVRWLHKTINLLKSNYSDADFLMWIDIISKHQTSITK